MDRFKDIGEIIVRQKFETLELFTGFEGKNRYSVESVSKESLFYVAERSSLILRNILQGLRPLDLFMSDLSNDIAFVGKKPFRFYFGEINVFSDKDVFWGRVVRKWAFLVKKLEVLGIDGVKIYDIETELMHPWTFKIKQNGAEVGTIVKRWSGVGKEIFSDADNFSIKFPIEASFEIKILIIYAVLLIDLTYFDKR